MWKVRSVAPEENKLGFTCKITINLGTELQDIFLVSLVFLVDYQK